MKTKELVLLAACTAILFAVQVALRFLPNVELVSLLIILFALTFGKKVFISIIGFILLEGMLYGFGLWWIMYLYVWPLLAFFACLFQKQKSPLFWAILSGTFGLGFGFLCSIPYFFSSGLHTMVVHWINGIPFDLVHCAGNFIIALLLFRPFSILLKKIAT